MQEIVEPRLRAEALPHLLTDHATPQTRRVGTGTGENPRTDVESPLDLLYSLSDGETDQGVRRIQVADKGSQPKCARVLVQGVPAIGIIDSGADITIIGGELFKKVSAGAKLKK